MALSTLAAVESGRRPPSLAVLTAVLATAGLELALDVPVPVVDDATVRHLRRSLAQRLHLACGGDGRPGLGRQPAAWTQLVSVAAHSTVHLHGWAARALWLPGGAAAPVQVCASERRPAFQPPLPTPALDVLPGCGRRRGSPVVVGLAHSRVLADPPGELALDPEHASHRVVLRAVARLLHEQTPVDAAGRRPRAHRDPDHRRERSQVFHTKRFHRIDMPPRHDTRSWRLDDDASLVAWLRRYDHPV